MAEGLFEEQIRDVLARAEEIHRSGGHEGAWRHEADAVIRAAEEAGLPREAVEKALEERLGIQMSPPKVGERVFAKSSDGKYYVAQVLESDSRQVRVKFAKGGELNLAPDGTRPANFLPGEKVECPWPTWGWWTCSIISFNAETGTIKVSDGWGSNETFRVSDVRLSPPRPPQPRRAGRTRTLLTMYLLGFVSGGALGGWITWVLTR